MEHIKERRIMSTRFESVNNTDIDNIANTLANLLNNVTATIAGHVENVTHTVAVGVDNVNETRANSPTTQILHNVATFTFPVIMFIGCAGNILSLITVLSRHCKKSCFTVLIAALAVADTLALLINGLQNWPPLFDIIRSYANTVQFWCKFLQFFAFVPANTSTCLVAAMTIERCIIAYFPLKFRFGFSPKTGCIVVGVITAVNIGLYGHLLYGFTVKTTQDITECTFRDDKYQTFFRYALGFIGFGAYFILPFIVIVFCNIATTIKTLGSGQNVGLSANEQERRKRAILRVVLVVSFGFLLLVSPFTLYAAIRPFLFDVEGYVLPQGNSTDALLIQVFSHLSLLNYSLNFFMYVLAGPRFRKDLKKALC